jgi:hypothetical protein
MMNRLTKHGSRHRSIDMVGSFGYSMSKHAGTWADLIYGNEVAGANAPKLSDAEGVRCSVWLRASVDCGIGAPYDGGYRSARAHQRANARRYRSRRNSQFEAAQWKRVDALL